MMGAGLLLAAVALSVYYCSTGLNGPQFLGLYTCLFAIYWISAELLRSCLSMRAAVIPASIFFGTGVVRIVLGLQHDLHRFGLLILGMVIGSVLILLGTNSVMRNGKQSVLARCFFPVFPAIGMGLSFSLFFLLGWAPFILAGVLVLVIYSIATVDKFGGLSGGWSGGGCSGGDGGGGGGCGGGGCGGCGGGGE